jgi:hypothetical protein
MSFNKAAISRSGNGRTGQGYLWVAPTGRDLICTPMKRSVGCCALLSGCPIAFERGKLRPWVYYCLFGLLRVSGLRLGEARNLEHQGVDLNAAVLTIRGAKFGKTRLVPLHTSTCTVLADYIARRQRHWAGTLCDSEPSINRTNNVAYVPATV